MDFKTLKRRATEETLHDLSQPVPTDQLVISASSAVEDLDLASNLLARRMRTWYELHAPEVSFAIEDDLALARSMLGKSKQELLTDVKATHDSGGALGEKDIAIIRALAQEVTTLAAAKERLETYIDGIMQEHMPNLLALTTPLVGAKLLSAAGSLERLSRMAGSAIQLLGAEEAFFRFLHTKSRPPKYGVLFTHPIVNNLPARSKGRAARGIANKIAIGVRADYYKTSKTLGRELRKDLEAKYG